MKVVAHKGTVHAVAEPKVTREREATAQAQLPSAGGQVTKKRLDQKSLTQEAEAFVGRAAAVASAAKRPELEARRRELLAQSQAPGFWDDGERAAAVLRTFRAIDAQLGELDRLRELCQVARRRARDAKGELQLAGAGARGGRSRARGAAGRGAGGRGRREGRRRRVAGDLGRRQRRQPARPGCASWSPCTGAGPSAAATRCRWLAEGDEPLRAVLHLHGPGVFGFLSGERGTHRRIDDDARLSAYVRLYRPVGGRGARCPRRSSSRAAR